MRRLILNMSMSVDGFVVDASGGTDWQTRNRSDEGRAWVGATLRDAGLHVMGSRTYRDMARFWPTATGPLASAMNEIPKLVFTRGPAFEPSGAWPETRVARGDLATEIGRLKREPGKDLLAHGGAAFAQSLTRLGLVDEYRLLVHPIALGAGRSLFADLPEPIDLALSSTSVFASGVTAQIYRPV